jgi:hypothetical protein
MSAPTKVEPLGYSEAFQFLDKISQAKVDLQGTIAVALEIIAANADEAVAETMARLIEADSDALDAAFDAAHMAICPPRPAGGYTPSGEGSAA